VTALEAVAAYLPPDRIRIDDLADLLSMTPMQVKMFHRVHGLAEVPWDREATLYDLLAAAVGKLDALRGREHHVRFVLHGRSMPVAVPYPLNPLHELCRALGLGHATALTVTQQACATGLVTLDLAGRLLAGCGDPDALALVLTGEKAFTQEARLMPNITIFGEGAAACLVSATGTRDRMLGFATRTRGGFDGPVSTLPEVAAEFQRQYHEALAEVILAALAQAGVALADLALVLPHNVNTISWRQLSRRIGLPIERVLLDNVAVTGHSFCADAFINYQTAAERGLLRPGDRYLVGAVGGGGTFSAMVFEH
jgi:3-oxoacyl-[acyl-carrier-protein] synthase-3